MTEPSTSTANIHPSVAKSLARTVSSYGVCPKKLFAKVGVNVDLDLQPDARIDGQINDKLWQLATDAVNDDAIGIAFTQHVHVSAFHGLIHAWTASETLYDAFTRLAQYFSVISTAGQVEVREVRKQVHIVLVLPVPYGIANDSGVDSSLALFLHLCRLVRGDQFKPHRVEYQRPKPKSYRLFKSFFDCPLTFDAPENKLIFSISEMQRPLPESNPALVKTLERFMLDYLRTQQARNIVAEISMLVVSNLPSGAPSQQQIADELHISRKTLQRRLSAENTTLAKIVEDIRLQQAHRFLLQDWRTISEVCYLLGFTEPSNFARWFKKVKGVSPQVYRSS